VNGRVLLDANFIVAVFRQDADALAALMAAGRIFVPSIVLGELYFGARKSERQEANTARIDRFAAVNEVLLPDVESAR
jgi:tRNA(fMet)-specific endonuclease VapC